MLHLFLVISSKTASTAQSETTALGKKASAILQMRRMKIHTLIIGGRNIRFVMIVLLMRLSKRIVVELSILLMRKIL